MGFILSCLVAFTAGFVIFIILGSIAYVAHILEEHGPWIVNLKDEDI